MEGMNHKRRRPKNRRAGCLLCKPHKANGVDDQRRQEERARVSEREQILEIPEPLPPEEVERLLQEGIELAREEHKRVASMRCRPSRLPLR